MYSEKLTDDNVGEELKDADGILLPGGFGDSGINVMICVAKFARENHVPLFGICLGMQIICIEFARNVCNFKDANSIEFNEITNYLDILLMETQMGIVRKGGMVHIHVKLIKKAPCIKLANKI